MAILGTNVLFMWVRSGYPDPVIETAPVYWGQIKPLGQTLPVPVARFPRRIRPLLLRKGRHTRRRWRRQRREQLGM